MLDANNPQFVIFFLQWKFAYLTLESLYSAPDLFAEPSTNSPGRNFSSLRAPCDTAPLPTLPVSSGRMNDSKPRTAVMQHARRLESKYNMASPTALSLL